MITSALQRTALAGVPLEYFHPDAFGVFHNRVGRPKWTIEEYLKTVESHRTSENGIFGMKIHYAQLDRALKSPAQKRRLLSRFDRFFFISRRNKLAQAVSFYRGNLTNVWKAESEEELKAAQIDLSKYDRLKIARLLASVISEEDSWAVLLSDVVPGYHRIYYEDLVADYSRVIREVIDVIGLTNVPEFVFQSPQIKKIGDEINLAWHDRFLDDLLGSHDAPYASRGLAQVKTKAVR